MSWKDDIADIRATLASMDERLRDLEKSNGRRLPAIIAFSGILLIVLIVVQRVLGIVKRL